MSVEFFIRNAVEMFDLAPFAFGGNRSRSGLGWHRADDLGVADFIGIPDGRAGLDR